MRIIIITIYLLSCSLDVTTRNERVNLISIIPALDGYGACVFYLIEKDGILYDASFVKFKAIEEGIRLTDVMSNQEYKSYDEAWKELRKEVFYPNEVEKDSLKSFTCYIYELKGRIKGFSISSNFELYSYLDRFQSDTIFVPIAIEYIRNKTSVEFTRGEQEVIKEVKRVFGLPDAHKLYFSYCGIE